MVKFNSVAIHAGHGLDGKVGSGSIGKVVGPKGNIIINKESTLARLVVKSFIKYANKYCDKIQDLTVNDGTSQGDILNKLVIKHNSANADINLSIHFNMGAKDEKGNGRTTGVEALVYNTNSSNIEADRICKSISNLGFSNRKLKNGSGKAVIRRTKNKMVLVECCFLDDYDDVKLLNVDTLAKAIVEGLFDVKIDNDIGSDNKMVKRCVLYDNPVDEVIARNFTIYDPICKVSHIDNFKSYSAENLYVVGGSTLNKLKSKNLPDKYTAFNGIDRKDTLDLVYKFISAKF